jgi:hypothetical protein
MPCHVALTSMSLEAHAACVVHIGLLNVKQLTTGRASVVAVHSI